MKNEDTGKAYYHVVCSWLTPAVMENRRGSFLMETNYDAGMAFVWEKAKAHAEEMSFGRSEYQEVCIEKLERLR